MTPNFFDVLITWLDKELSLIEKEELYKFFFEGIEIDKQEDDAFYISNYDKGINAVLSKEKIIETVHFFGRGYSEFNSFKDQLIYSNLFSFSREKILETFGVPNRNGGGGRSLLLGYTNVWDKYYFPNYSLRFEYTKDEDEIVLVTIASLKLETYFNSGLQ